MGEVDYSLMARQFLAAALKTPDPGLRRSLHWQAFQIEQQQAGCRTVWRDPDDSLLFVALHAALEAGGERDGPQPG